MSALLGAALWGLAATSGCAQNPPAQDKPEQVVVLDTAARAEAAGAAERAGQLDRAVELYRALAEDEPKEARWPLAAARCLRRAHRFNDAISVLAEAEFRIPHDPDLPSMRATTYHLKAEAQLREGVRSELAFLFEEAADVARAILERHPDHREARLTLALSLFQLADIDGARAQAEEAIERFPEHPGGHLVIGKIEFFRFVTADAKQREAEPRSKEWAKLAEESAKIAGAATRAYENALALDPDRADAHVQLGNIYGTRGNREQAMVAFGKALAIDPLAAVNHGWIAQVATPKRRARMYDEALAAHRERGETDPAKLGGLQWWSARTKFDAADYEAAFPLFVAAAQRERYATGRYYAMLCAHRSGQREQAQEQASRFASESPQAFADFVRELPQKDETIGVLQVLADQSFEAERLAQSRDINHVLALTTESTEHWNNYAFLARETQQFTQALSGYERALEKEPDSPRLLNDAAVILQYHLQTPENLDRARAMYQRAIKLANQTLNDPAASDLQKKAATSAKSDARGNLAKLGR